jgi:transposase
MDIETWALIRRLHFRDGLSRQEISRQIGHCRDTVARAIAMEIYTAPKRPLRGSQLDAFKTTIAKLLEEYPSLTGVRVFEEIRKLGYRGSLTLIRDHLRKIRPPAREVFARLHFEPGEAFQVDWASCGTIAHEGTQRRLSAFLMVACFSRMLYVEFTLSEATEDFLRCHQNGFRFFGGVFRQGIYDNLRSAVLFHIGDEVRFNPRFLDFVGFYLFEPRACRSRNPQEKGRVENAVRFLRTSFLLGRSFRSFAEVQAEASRWRDEVANVRLHRTTLKRPVDLFEEERRHLRALPPTAYDTRVVRTVKATHQARVHFDSNTYSVPPAFGAVVLTLKASPQDVEILSGEQVVASHRRAWGRGVDVVDPEHERTLRKRKRRVEESLLERDFRELSAGAGKYLEGLCHAAVNPYLQMRKILGLVGLYGRAEVVGAIERALVHEAFGFDYVENIVLQERHRRSLPPAQPLTFHHNDDLAELSLPERDLEDYDRLFEEGDDHVGS